MPEAQKSESFHSIANMIYPTGIPRPVCKTGQTLCGLTCCPTLWSLGDSNS